MARFLARKANTRSLSGGGHSKARHADVVRIERSALAVKHHDHKRPRSVQWQQALTIMSGLRRMGHCSSTKCITIRKPLLCIGELNQKLLGTQL